MAHLGPFISDPRPTHKGYHQSNFKGAHLMNYDLGSTGPFVKAIQAALPIWTWERRLTVNNPQDVIDGVYGFETKAAVTLYQRRQKLKADGICGLKTLEKLGLLTSI